jgi:hypothetical protein
MKKLIEQHRDEMHRFTSLNLDQIQKKVKYLHDFDREVQ